MTLSLGWGMVLAGGCKVLLEWLPCLCPWYTDAAGRGVCADARAQVVMAEVTVGAAAGS